MPVRQEVYQAVDCAVAELVRQQTDKPPMDADSYIDAIRRHTDLVMGPADVAHLAALAVRCMEIHGVPKR